MAILGGMADEMRGDAGEYLSSVQRGERRNVRASRRTGESAHAQTLRRSDVPTPRYARLRFELVRHPDTPTLRRSNAPRSSSSASSTPAPATPFLVIILTVFGIAGGIWALTKTPLDAIPDLSDVQVIVYTDWEGRSPDLVEDQITYPISTRFIAAPKVKFVRGESMFGKSFVYVIFEDGTDIYWARSRVIEYLSAVRGMLPEGVNPVIGPDATGVGWVYEYALVDKTGKHNLAELRSFQDWHLRYALESVKGVSEVAAVGGFVKQYQVDLDPNKLLAYGIPINEVVNKIRMSNGDVGGKIFEVGSTEFYVRGRGYIKKRRGHRERAAQITKGNSRLCEKCRHGSPRPGHPAWRCRTERRRRSRRRHRRHALRRKCAARH